MLTKLIGFIYGKIVYIYKRALLILLFYILIWLYIWYVILVKTYLTFIFLTLVENVYHQGQKRLAPR